MDALAGPDLGADPGGIVPTEDQDGAVYVFPLAASLDAGAELTCDWRDGDLW